MTDTQRQLLRAIIENPDEDSVRLEYADCIQEQGEDDRAEFIRVQCELARIEADLSSFDTGGEPGVFRKGIVPKVRELRHRERELFAANAAKWRFRESYEYGGEHLWACFLDPVPEDAASSHTVYKRGFVNSLSCTAEEFLKNADKLVWNEKMTDECLECRGHGKISDPWFAGDDSCSKCYACEKGRVPRPMPDTAQPITKVKLTTLPGFNDSPCDYLRIEHVTGERQSVVTTGSGRREHRIPTSKWDATDQVGRVKMLFSLEWPGIEFELPVYGTSNANVPEFDPEGDLIINYQRPT